MKRKSIFYIAIIFCILIIGGLVYFNMSGLNKLSVNEVIEKMDNKDSFILCISKKTCSYCDLYKPKLKKVSKNYDIEIFYIDIDRYDKKEREEFEKYISFNGSTPVTVFIKNGEEVTTSNRIIGNASYDKIVKKIKGANFIK